MIMIVYLRTGEDLGQLMSVLTDHIILSAEQQALWIEDGNGKF